MIVTKAEMINQLPPEMIDTFTIHLIIGVVLIVLGIVAGYIQGRTVAKMASDEFWALQQEIKVKDAKAKSDKLSEAAHKGHETRKRRAKDVAIILECDL